MQNSREMSAADVVAEWVNSYGDELYSWTYYKTGNREIAEDIVQECFLSAFKAFHRFKDGSNPKTWLFTILNNKIIDYYRSRSSQKHISESELRAQSQTDGMFNQQNSWTELPATDWDEEPHLLDRPEFLVVLKKCLNALPERWRAVTIAKFFDYKKGNTISKELGLSPSNLWQIVHRSKLKLKNCLDKNWHFES
jgi:RNA polymerase sigma-70 factor (ECF subfamily)